MIGERSESEQWVVQSQKLAGAAAGGPLGQCNRNKVAVTLFFWASRQPSSTLNQRRANTLKT